MRKVALDYSMVVVVLLSGAIAARAATPEDAELTAIRAAGGAYLAAMKHGDVDTVRSMWTAEGDYVDAAGVVHKARDLFRTGPEQPSTTQESTADPKWDSTLRLVTPNVAIEDGILRNVGEEDAEGLSRRFTAIWVKREGRWLLDGLREATVAAPQVKSQLRELDWLVGEWAGKLGDTAMLISAHYSDDGKFLVRTSMVRAPSGDVLTGTERIGWDAQQGMLKSYAFDSTGSTSQATWHKADGQWVVESSIVMPDGEQVNTKASYQPTGPKTFRWSAANSQPGADEAPSPQIEFQRAADE